MDGDSVKVPALELYTTDITALARAGSIDPVLERETEIAQMINILLFRPKRHLLSAACYQAERQGRFETWRQIIAA